MSECPGCHYDARVVHSWTYEVTSHPLNRVFLFCGAPGAQRAMVLHCGNIFWGYCVFKDEKPFLHLDVANAEIPLFSDTK